MRKRIETVYEKDGTDMATLLETWRNLAYGDGLDDKKKEEKRDQALKEKDPFAD